VNCLSLAAAAAAASEEAEATKDVLARLSATMHSFSFVDRQQRPQCTHARGDGDLKHAAAATKQRPNRPDP
jgi:hypothetical protein